jgi:RNA polymerase sigma factor (sigma-70 family)
MPPSPVPAPTPAVDPWAVALAYLPLVDQVARGFHVCRFDRDDLVQEGLIGVYRAVGKNDPARDTFRGLAWVAAQNRMRDWLRWQRKDPPVPLDAAPVADRVDRVDATELAEALAAIDRLPDRRRTILREHFGLDGPPRLEAAIGSDLGVSRDVIAQNKFRALGKVREHLGIAS